jgi:hypothetical protein
MSRSGPSKPEVALGHAYYAGVDHPFIFKEAGGVFESNDPQEYVLANAAWHFCKCAHQALSIIPEQASKEGDVDSVASLRGIADSICLAYGVDIEEMMKRMPLCRQLAFKLSRNWDSKFQTWLDSGGKSYDIVDRDPDKV